MQLHLILPFKLEARDHPRVRERLAQGYRLADLQRLTDREVLVVLERASS